MKKGKVTERRHLKDLREFFTRNRVPLDVLEKLLRDKRQNKYLKTYNRIARIINQHEDLTRTN